jgi:hypothetical protein
MNADRSSDCRRCFAWPNEFSGIAARNSSAATFIADDAYAAKALTVIDKANGGSAASEVKGVDTLPVTVACYVGGSDVVRRLQQGFPVVGMVGKANGQDGRHGVQAA